MDQNVTPKMSLTRLPRDTLLCIVDAILETNYDRSHPVKWSWDPDKEPEPGFNPRQAFRDALSLAATCKTLYTDLTGGIYRKDVQHNGSAALLRSAITGNVSSIVRSLDAGANIHMGDITQGIIVSKSTLTRTGRPKKIPSRTWHPWDMSDQVTALHWAAYYGHSDVVTLLLERGADIDHRVRLDSRPQLDISNFHDPGQAAYSYPADFCCDLVRRNISSGGAFLKSVEKAVAIWTLEHGANPLYFAIEGGDLGTSILLIEKGASLDTHLGTRVHALHQAVANCEVNLVEFLLSINQVANRINTIQDGRRGSALHCLNYGVEEDWHANCQIIKLLVSHGCPLNILNNYNHLPVDEAENALCPTAVAELIRHGSHLPRFLLSNGRIPEEILLAIGEVQARGLFIPIRSWNTMISSEIRGGWWMYPHFYKLVHRTNSIPVPLSGFTLFQWILYWEARPFAYTVLPGQESMLQVLVTT